MTGWYRRGKPADMLVAWLSLAVFILAFFAWSAYSALGYTDPANVISATINDMRVNPNQSVTWTPGPVLNATGLPVGGGNSSLSFNGSTQYVSVNWDASLDPDTAITVEHWIRPDTVTPASTMRITQRSGLWGTYMTTSGDMVFYVDTTNDGGAFKTISYNLPAAGQWYHVVGTYDGANMRLYVNGSPITPVAQTKLIDTAVSTLYIGNSATTQYFDGRIDELRMYNRSLSSSEAAQHYQGTYLNESGLVLYLDFDGEALDQSGNGNDGTLQNGPAYTDGWASVPVSTYMNGTLSSSGRLLVNSTTGDALNFGDTAPATWGNYTAELAPDTSIGNATVPGFTVDTIGVDLHAVYSTVPTSLPATVYADAYSLVDGGNLTSADSLTVGGYPFTWNAYTGRFETQITKATPQSHTLSAVTSLLEATYGITTGTVLTPVTVTVVQRGSSLIYQYLAMGDIGGLIFSVYTQALNIQVTWLIIMIIGSVFLYRRLGAIPTALIWLLSWGGFVAVFPPVAINLAVGMLLISVAALIFLAFFYWRRSTS